MYKRDSMNIRGKEGIIQSSGAENVVLYLQKLDLTHHSQTNTVHGVFSYLSVWGTENDFLN